jgi:protein gp37
VLLKPGKLTEPLSGSKDWRGLGAAAAAAGKTDGKLVFVNSMSDLFHENVPSAFVDQVFDVMRRAPQHTFQVLTKRPERMREYMLERSEPAACVNAPWLPLKNVWLGVSIENRRYVHRADVLRDTPAAVRFISAEPLLGSLTDATCLCCGEPVDHYDLCFECANDWCARCGFDEATGERLPGSSDPYAAYPRDRLSLHGIVWLIVGGESGAHARPMDVRWARDLRDAAVASGTAFFFKQVGGRTPKAGGRELDGRTWDEFPRRLVVATRQLNKAAAT